MMDFNMVVTAAAGLIGLGLVLGLVVGYVVGRRSRRPPDPPSPPNSPDPPKCSCEHGAGFHEGLAGLCHFGENRGAPNTDGPTPRCPCLIYDGPEPAPRWRIPPRSPWFEQSAVPQQQ